jgi:adenosine deaminase
VRSLATHPMRLYFNLGARVTVNTDNRLITDTNVSKELWVCHAEMGMPLADIKQIILNGFKSAFMPFHEKRRFLETISAELAAFDPGPHEDEGEAAFEGPHGQAGVVQAAG